MVFCASGTAEEPMLAAPDRSRPAGDDPGRRALEEREPLDLRRDFRDELDRGGAGADDGNSPTGEVVVVTPTGRVEHGPGEARKTGHVGQRRVGEWSGGGNDHAR